MKKLLASIAALALFLHGPAPAIPKPRSAELRQDATDLLLKSLITPIGFFKRATVASAVTFLGGSQDISNATTYTFSSFTFGTASSTRQIFVGVWGRASSGTASISSVTIGGTSATAKAAIVTNGVAGARIYGASIPTGTSGNIVVTWGSSMIRCYIAVWAVVGCSTAVFDTGSSTASDPSTTIDCSANGIIMAISGGGSSTSPTASWTGVTEDIDIGIDDGGIQSSYSAASIKLTSAATARTIQCTISGTEANSLLTVISINPL